MHANLLNILCVRIAQLFYNLNYNGRRYGGHERDRMIVGFYNYLCKQCLSPLKLQVWILFLARCTRCNFMWYSLSVTCGRSLVFSPGTPVTSTIKLTTTSSHPPPNPIRSKVRASCIWSNSSWIYIFDIYIISIYHH